MTFRPNKRRTPGGLHDGISEAYAQVGGLETAAGLMQVGRTLAHSFSDESADTSKGYGPMSVMQAYALTLAGATALAEVFARASGGVYLPPLDAASGPLGALGGAAGKEFGEAIARLYQDLDDRVLDQREARALLPEWLEASRAVNAVVRAIEAIAKGEGEGAS